MPDILSILKDVDEIDHVTVHYRRSGKPLDKKEAARLIKKDSAVYNSVKNTDLGFDAKFITENDLTENELFAALVKIREILMSDAGLPG